MWQIVDNCAISAYPSHSSSTVQKLCGQLLFLYHSPKKMAIFCDEELIA
jgi:hypothetical protein